MQIEAETDKLKDVFQVMKMHIHEGILQFQEDKLRIQAADPANHMMIDVTFDTDFFKTYDPEVEKHDDYRDRMYEDTVLVGLHFENLYEVLDKFRSSDEVTLTIEENMFAISGENSELKLPVLNLDPTDYIVNQVDTLEFSSSVNVVAEEFINQVAKLAMIDSPVETEFQEDIINMEADSKAAGAKARIQHKGLDGEAGITSLYDNEKLGDVKDSIKKLYARDQDVLFEIGDEKPFKLEFSENDYRIRIFVAPRIRD